MATTPRNSKPRSSRKTIVSVKKQSSAKKTNPLVKVIRKGEYDVKVLTAIVNTLPADVLRSAIIFFYKLRQ
jgi:hypothetical protein